MRNRPFARLSTRLGPLLVALAALPNASCAYLGLLGQVVQKPKVSVRSVETSRTRLLGKLGVPNTAALVRLAILGGLVPPSAALPRRMAGGRPGVSR